MILLLCSDMTTLLKNVINLSLCNIAFLISTYKILDVEYILLSFSMACVIVVFQATFLKETEKKNYCNS